MTALVIFKYVSFELSREDVCAGDVHIINETMGGEFLNEGLHRK